MKSAETCKEMTKGVAAVRNFIFSGRKVCSDKTVSTELAAKGKSPDNADAYRGGKCPLKAALPVVLYNRFYFAKTCEPIVVMTGRVLIHLSFVFAGL